MSCTLLYRKSLAVPVSYSRQCAGATIVSYHYLDHCAARVPPLKINLSAARRRKLCEPGAKFPTQRTYSSYFYLEAHRRIGNLEPRCNEKRPADKFQEGADFNFHAKTLGFTTPNETKWEGGRGGARASIMNSSMHYGCLIIPG